MNPDIRESPVGLLLHWARERPQQVWLQQPTADGERRWTWSQAADEVGRMAAALRAQSWPAGSRIAISGFNTAHWFLADLAIQMAGLTPVGLYPKQAPKATHYILEHSETRAVFLGPMMDADSFVPAIPAGVLRISLPYADAPAGDTDWDRLAAGHAPEREYARPAPESLLTLVYTSGTTGDPKGVVVTHANIAFVAQGFLHVMGQQPGERLLSYLPLAHLLERAAVEYASLHWGAQVHFLEKLEKLPHTLPQVRPTRFFAVPLVWTRFHAGIVAKLPERRLRSLARIPGVGALLAWRLRRKLGLDAVRSCISGAAPLPRATMEFFRDVMRVDILEGYGLTETGAYLSMNLPGAKRIGSVGKPFPDAGFRLSAEGEIQCRHGGVMPGYYCDEARTREAFTADGWFRTGDKGRLDGEGFLHITGRVKDIFKTLKGKYVAPAPIESALAANTDIDQLCLVGAGLTQPVMLLTLTAAARARPPQELEPALLASLQAVNAGLEDHERLAKLLVADDAWTIDNGLLTPTLKVRREAIERHYGEAIERGIRDRAQAIAWL